MTTWNNGQYPPPQQGGYPPQQPYPGGAGYPPQGGYPPQPGFPPQGGFPAQGGFPPQGGYPPSQGGYPPPGGVGFQPPPPTYGQGDPYNQADMYGTNFPEDGGPKNFDFSDQSIRRGFIRKVYSILMVQLAITVGMIALFLYHEPTKRYVQHHMELWIIAMVVFFVAMIAMACCGDLRRKSPLNYVFLFIFTVAFGFVTAVSASRYDADAVLMAAGITAAVCLGLTLFAFQTKWDFTMMGGVLFVAVIVLMIFGIVAIFLPKSKTLTLVYASLGALIFSLYLIYDTQLMLGGNHKYSISPEEYVFAALNLYLDIVQIFMYILTIIGASRD